MDEAGADGFVLFNRFYQPDINFEYLKPHYFAQFKYRIGKPFANALCRVVIFAYSSQYLLQQWHSPGGNDVVKMILAGADCVQVVSTLYQNKISHISKIVSDIEQWMNEKNYKSLPILRENFRRKM